MAISFLTTRIKRAVLLASSIGLAFLWTAAIRSSAHGALMSADFGEFYFSARCAFDRLDPYNPEMVLREFEKDGMNFPADGSRDLRSVMTVMDYPPTTLVVVAPFAELPWTVALLAWLGLMAGSLVLAAVLTWDLATDASSLAGWTTSYMLATCVVLLLFGNSAGFAISFGVIAAWCFLRERYALAGVVLLALSLAMKPQIAGFQWLYFLLAGGIGRKRAWQTLAITLVLGACAFLWITPSSPHWFQELHRNIAIYSARGGSYDPGPSGHTYRSFDQIVSLQSAVSVFENDPRFYKPVTYLITGALILMWIVAVLRKRRTREGALLALAAISFLTLLPIYHATHDAKLLLLAIPACAMLWARNDVKGQVAAGLTWAAIIVTSDFPMMFLLGLIWNIPVSPGLGGKLALLAIHPAPLVLLAAGCFYLWVFVCWNPPEKERLGGESAAGAVPLPAG